MIVIVCVRAVSPAASATSSASVATFVCVDVRAGIATENEIAVVAVVAVVAIVVVVVLAPTSYLSYRD